MPSGAPAGIELAASARAHVFLGRYSSGIGVPGNHFSCSRFQVPSCIASCKRLVERLAERVVALLDDEAGRRVEGRHVDRDLQIGVALDILLGRFIVGEVRRRSCRC